VILWYKSHVLYLFGLAALVILLQYRQNEQLRADYRALVAGMAVKEGIVVEKPQKSSIPVMDKPGPRFQPPGIWETLKADDSELQ